MHAFRPALIDQKTRSVDPESHSHGRIPALGHILVADDNPLSLAFFAEAIALAGHLATTAADGRQAVATAACQRFDLLLLDTRMPGLDGPAALHSIRSGSGPSRQSPAVATSADAGISRPGLLDAGFGEVLIKPVAIDALRALLDRYLGHGEPGDAVLLDHALALEKAGGSETVVAALRQLLDGELQALPAEIGDFARNADRKALLERLHRLEASAGFCGTPSLAQAVATLRAKIDAGSAWPDSALVDFLAVCARTREALR
jgi:CheY-like chemotaxis protein/HPt (histidine-containing phosphotransfer) domain-containing protein